jgi:polyisoprenoid-binding protein YceI
MNKKITVYLLLLAIVVCSFIAASSYSVSDEGSAIIFKIKNFGLTTEGGFKHLQGHIIFDPSTLNTASFDATVEANTIYTGNTMRDNHLKKPEYFNASAYPRISITSTKITNLATKKDNYVFEGKLTIKNTTKPITFPFTATPKGNDYLFEGSFKINRKDFGIGGSSISLADNLTIFLSVTAKKK